MTGIFNNDKTQNYQKFSFLIYLILLRTRPDALNELTVPSFSSINVSKGPVNKLKYSNLEEGNNFNFGV